MQNTICLKLAQYTTMNSAFPQQNMFRHAVDMLLLETEKLSMINGQLDQVKYRVILEKKTC